MNKLLVLLVLVLLWPMSAYADAMLTGSGAPAFPTKVTIDISVRAQIEATTIELELPPITAAGSYRLTVPVPAGASPFGVDIDRGQGFVPLPVVAGAPPAASGGSSEPAVTTWAGTAPLVAVLDGLEPGPLTARVRLLRVLRRVAGQVAFEVGARRCPARANDDPGAPTTVSLQLYTGRDLVSLDASGAIVEPGVRGGGVRAGPLHGDVVVGVRYVEASAGIGVSVVTHRTPTADPMGGDAGYFMLVVDANPAPSTMPRALSLVIDRSGSMSGDKIAQARDSARAMLDYLRPEDSFTLHTFDGGVDSFRAAPVAASAANIQAARDYIKRIASSGSTNLDGGLRTALAPPPRAERFDAVVLLSDGLPTTGETDAKAILANAWRASGGDTRIFTFSVGSDADHPLMEALARGSRGRHVDLNNAQATSDLVHRARELFEDIRDVRLTDLELAINGIGAVDTLPEAPPDLFGGGQVIVVGRYATPGAGEVRVTGFEGQLPLSRTITFEAPAHDDRTEIIKYVWAHEKVRTLHAAIANGGDAAALRAEIEAIGIAYRIQTPFTHYAGDVGSYASDGQSGCASTRGTGWLVTLVIVMLVTTRRPRPLMTR